MFLSLSVTICNPNAPTLLFYVSVSHLLSLPMTTQPFAPPTPISMLSSPFFTLIARCLTITSLF
jgi:hypothetical protein